MLGEIESEPHKQINFVAGDTVVIQGLRNKVEANGRRAVVQSFDSIHGGYIVLIDGDNKPAKLKPQNLLSEPKHELEPEPEPERWQCINMRFLYLLVSTAGCVGIVE